MLKPHFSVQALGFLRDLAENNDRSWFEAHKDVYERELKAPFLELIGALNEALAEFAPEHVRPPQRAMMRIYRDVRFSANKAPYKTHLAAWWAREGMEKTSGAGFYLEISAVEVTVAAGAYMPAPEQLLAIRRHLEEHHAEWRALLADTKLRSLMEEFDGQTMTRVPKGFRADDPAAELLKRRQWGVAAELPAARALEPGLLQEVVRRFRAAAPLTAWLNAPLARRVQRAMF
jgi:uncharacterized protein (TIGR02453 family)